MKGRFDSKIWKIRWTLDFSKSKYNFWSRDFSTNFVLLRRIKIRRRKIITYIMVTWEHESCELSIILWTFRCTTPRNNGHSREPIKLLLSLYLQRTHCNHEYTYWERILKCCWRNQAWINSTLSVRSCFDQAEIDYQFVHGLMIFLLFLDRSIDSLNGWYSKNEDSSACVFCKRLFFYQYCNYQNPKFKLNFFT